MATDNRRPIVPFRLSPDTLYELDAIQAYHGLESRAGAVAFAVRAAAREIIAKMDAALETEIASLNKARKKAARAKRAPKDKS